MTEEPRSGKDERSSRRSSGGVGARELPGLDPRRTVAVPVRRRTVGIALNAIHPIVVADNLMMVFLGLTVVPQHP